MKIENTLPPYINNINQIAEDIAISGVENLESNIPKLIENEAGFEANIEVIKTKDDLLGYLLDLKA